MRRVGDVGNLPLFTHALAAAIASALTLGASHAGAQDTGQSGARPAFDVASVKLHVTGSGAGRSDPGRFVLGGISLAGLIMRAYGLQVDRQLDGPEWTHSVFFDIDAKMPEGAAKEQIPRMLQTLLADRLKLAVHQESRIMPVYQLTVAKGGLKVKEVDPSRFVDEIIRPSPHGFRGHFTMAPASSNV
jgi:uncharacterized protein (TIGR03435 family)